MRTFAIEPKATQRTTSPTSPIPGRAYLGRSRGVNSIFVLQRTIGNQNVERPLQANSDPLEAVSDATVSGRFDHNFSRIAVHAIAPVEEADRVSEISTNRSTRPCIVLHL